MLSAQGLVLCPPPGPFRCQELAQHQVRYAEGMLAQAERTARNNGLPLLCVGRRMSRDNLVLSLAPLLARRLLRQQAQSRTRTDNHDNASKEGDEEATMIKQLVADAGVPKVLLAQRQASAVSGNGKLQPGWRERMMQAYGMLPQPDSAEGPTQALSASAPTARNMDTELASK
jgi:hypothetical protein